MVRVKMVVPNERESNVNSFAFGRTDNVGLGLAVTCLNLIVALALVTFSLLLGLAVSSLACVYDRSKETQPSATEQSGG
jgi:hypothetical protein